ncbi:MAG: hypothetical protein ABI556_10050 [Gemmatimonadales bacterium]
MRIERIRKEITKKGARVVADVAWEEHAAPPDSLVIETSDQFATDFQPSPDAFLLALFPIAQWRGEKRILVEGSICCRLRDGLSAASELFAIWHPHCRPIEMEPTAGFAPTVPRTSRRAASFMSGGIDALSMLRSNQLDYAPSHPASIRDCLLLHGVHVHDHDANGISADWLARFDAYRERMEIFARDAGVTLIPVYTNIRTLYPTPSSWSGIGYGAGLISIAHCFSSRIDRIKIASVGIGMRAMAHGSQPWLDHHFSTDAVSVDHEQAAMTRFEKTRVVSDWPEAMSILRPCFGSAVAEGAINCGRCEKCVRTMLALVALKKLDRAPTFPFDNVTAEMLAPVWIDDPFSLIYHLQCVDALTARGRLDLVELILRKRDAYRHWQRRQKILAAARRALGLGRGSSLQQHSQPKR